MEKLSPELDEISSMNLGSYARKTNSMVNVTETHSQGFKITIPEDTHLPDQNFGIFRSGAHGWIVFLKPLSPGHHDIYYDVSVSGIGTNPHSAQIIYSFQVIH